MVTAENFQQSLQALIDRHPHDLSIILRALGIGEDPSPRVLTLAYVKHGDRLTDLLEQLPEENFKGNHFKNLFEAGVSAITVETSPAGQSVLRATGDEAPKKKSATKWIIFTGVFVVVTLVVTLIVIRSLK